MDLQLTIDKFSNDLLTLQNYMECDPCIDHPSMVPRQEYYFSFYSQYKKEWFSNLIQYVTIAQLPPSILNPVHIHISNFHYLLQSKESQFKKFDDYSLIIKNLHIYADNKFQQIGEYQRTFGLENINNDYQLRNHYNFLTREKYEFLLKDQLKINYYREFQKLFSQLLNIYDSNYNTENTLEISTDIFPLNLTIKIHDIYVEEYQVFDKITWKDFHLVLNMRKSNNSQLKIKRKNIENAGFIINKLSKFYKVKDNVWENYMIELLHLKVSTYKSKSYNKVPSSEDSDAYKFYKHLIDILSKYKEPQ